LRQISSALEVAMFRLHRHGACWSGFVLACAVALPLLSGNRTLDPVDGSAILYAQELPPAFRTAVNLVALDVQVVATQGRPMPGLTAEQFDISIAGHKRRVVRAELLHADEGAIIRGLVPTAAALAACAFGFARSSKGVHAHYLLGIEPSDADRSGMKHPKVTVNDKTLAVRRLAWRSRVAATPGGR
jgi:hypothetical protein